MSTKKTAKPRKSKAYGFIIQPNRYRARRIALQHVMLSPKDAGWILVHLRKQCLEV